MRIGPTSIGQSLPSKENSTLIFSFYFDHARLSRLFFPLYASSPYSFFYRDQNHSSSHRTCFVDGRPSTAFCFFFRSPALFVTFFDVLGLTFLFAAVFRFT